MKAIGFKTSLPIDEANSFIEFEKEIPTAKGKDILVKVEAISVNPVDYKIRKNSLKNQQQDTSKVIGWDAVVWAGGDHPSSRWDSKGVGTVASSCKVLLFLLGLQCLLHALKATPESWHALEACKEAVHAVTS